MFSTTSLKEILGLDDHFLQLDQKRDDSARLKIKKLYDFMAHFT